MVTSLSCKVIRDRLHHEYAFAVFFDLGPLMPLAGIFNGKLVQAELFLHGFKFRRLRIRQSDPNKAVGLLNIEMNLANRDIGKFATILISDTIDKHCGQSLYDVEIKRGPGEDEKTS